MIKSFQEWRSGTSKTNSGVYVLWDGPELIYIGQSVNLRDRIHSHTIHRNVTCIQVVFMDDVFMSALEKHLIYTFRPTQNGNMPSKKSVEKEVRTAKDLQTYSKALESGEQWAQDRKRREDENNRQRQKEDMDLFRRFMEE